MNEAKTTNKGEDELEVQKAKLEFLLSSNAQDADNNNPNNQHTDDWGVQGESSWAGKGKPGNRFKQI